MNTLTNWRNKGQYFNYKSYRIFNIDEGVGEDILLIHGFPTASMDWSLMWGYTHKKISSFNFGYDRIRILLKTKEIQL